MRLKKSKIDIIFSSDSNRAVDTTKIIAKFHNVPVYYTKKLRNRDSGIFNGKEIKYRIAAYKSSGLSAMEFRPKRGESYLDVIQRTRKFTRSLYKKYKAKSILVSTHGGPIRAMAHIYLGYSIEESYRLDCKNAGMLILKIQSNSVKTIMSKMFKSKLLKL